MMVNVSKQKDNETSWEYGEGVLQEPLDEVMTPEEIEARSFELIEREIPKPRPFSGLLWEIARRCVHTTGDPTILPNLRLQEEGLKRGLSALRTGCKIYTDTAMAKCALSLRRFAPLSVSVQALMELPNIAENAQLEGITRARAGILAIADSLADAIVVLGNAPTALLCLLECLKKGAPVPRLIVGMPVGFVNAAQSKQLLACSSYPHFTLLGRKGGSAIAASCVNAMADIVLRERR